MPKRQTLIYTSNDGPRNDTNQLFVYYCKYSGKHAFTTDVDIESLPRRAADNARILDRTKYAVKLYTSDGGTKLLRRRDGKVEKQYRLNVGTLPVAYTSDPPRGDGEPGGGDDDAPDLLYVMDKAVTCYSSGERAPVPPCIKVGDSGNCEVAIEIEDRQAHITVGKISAEAVKVHITGSASQESSQNEILALMAKILTLRLNNLTLLRGATNRNRTLVVEMLSTRQVYARLRGIPMPQRRQDQPGSRKPKPWHHGL